jgi:hypothetical protein
VIRSQQDFAIVYNFVSGRFVNEFVVWMRFWVRGRSSRWGRRWARIGRGKVRTTVKRANALSVRQLFFDVFERIQFVLYLIGLHWRDLTTVVIIRLLKLYWTTFDRIDAVIILALIFKIKIQLFKTFSSIKDSNCAYDRLGPSCSCFLLCTWCLHLCLSIDMSSLTNRTRHSWNCSLPSTFSGSIGCNRPTRGSFRCLHSESSKKTLVLIPKAWYIWRKSTKLPHHQFGSLWS